MMTHAPIGAGPNILWHGVTAGTLDLDYDTRVVNERARAFSRFRGD